MLFSADFMRAVQVASAELHSGPHPLPASHDELLARRHAQRALRVSSLEAKLTSSFLPEDEASHLSLDLSGLPEEYAEESWDYALFSPSDGEMARLSAVPQHCTSESLD
ncbi:hypothetical protein T484DRAFT_1907815 [Baffinella frigidus]|nr:hypothetical protein T484DRAFT_1907815 [Cryptophyta sp. CCMP2293]